MFKIITILFLFFAVNMTTCLSVKADVIFVIDMDLSAAGVQSTRNVAAGANFDIGLVLLLDRGSEMSAFILGVNFNPNVMAVQTVDVSGPPSGFGNSDSVAIDNLLGDLRHFNTLSISSSLSTPQTLLATINLTAVSPMTDLSGDILPLFEFPGFHGVLDGQGEVVPLGLNSGDGGVFFQSGTLNVSAVPEPTTFSLFVLAAATGLAHRRRVSPRGNDIAK